MANFDRIKMKLVDPFDSTLNITNHVLFQEFPEDKKKSIEGGSRFQNEQAKKKDVAYYIPSYVRIKIKNFTKLDQENLQATINVVLIVVINMKDVPSLIQEEISEKLTLRFNRNPAINIGKKELLEVHRKKLDEGVLQFTIRTYLVAGIVG